ncbi:MAG: phosphatase PAP2 family protein [Saprospiraceae bacterium]|nr:phosphatase PAP2 family protein [Saprospiraceae bacterium]
MIALLVGFSRIYLIQHFLKDVYLGAIMGVAIAVIWYWLAPKILKSPRLEQSLLKKQA